MTAKDFLKYNTRPTTELYRTVRKWAVKNNLHPCSRTMISSSSKEQIQKILDAYFKANPIAEEQGYRGDIHSQEE